MRGYLFYFEISCDSSLELVGIIIKKSFKTKIIFSLINN